MLHFIWNPTAGHGKALRAREALEARLAGIDHRFHDTREKGDAARVAAVLTREAEGDAASIHGRMPVTFAPEDAALWLDPDADPAALLAEPPIPALCSAEPNQSAQISLWQALEG